MNDKELTYGGQAVGLKFNPSNDESVQHAKELCANLIDLINKAYTNPEQNLLTQHAVREIQTAQMWAVKALTYKS